MFVLQSSESGATGWTSANWWVYDIAGVHTMSITYLTERTKMQQILVCIVKLLQNLMFVVFWRNIQANKAKRSWKLSFKQILANKCLNCRTGRRNKFDYSDNQHEVDHVVSKRSATDHFQAEYSFVWNCWSCLPTAQCSENKAMVWLQQKLKFISSKPCSQSRFNGINLIQRSPTWGCMHPQKYIRLSQAGHWG